MISRIKEHNALNGIKFSIAEFVIVAGLISPFALYYFQHAQVLFALVSVGITLNCLTVAGFGLRQWLDHEPEIGWKRLLDKQERDRINHTHPHLLRDTTIITVTALAPYILLVLATLDLLISRKNRKSF